MNRTEKKRTRRKKIIEAAIETFAEKGFHKTKIIDIAFKAEVADGTIYLYFKNKEDLLITALSELFDSILSEMQEKINLLPESEQKLTKFIDLHLELITKNISTARFIAVELRQSPEFYKKYPEFSPLRNYLAYVQELAEDAITKGFIRKVDTNSLSYLIFGIVNFVITEWAIRGDIDLDKMHANILDILTVGLFQR